MSAPLPGMLQFVDPKAKLGQLCMYSAHAIEIDGLRLATAEHAFTYLKCRAFDDPTWELLQLNDDHKVAWDLRREVGKGQDDWWRRNHEFLALVRVLRVKTQQHADVRACLAATGKCTLAFASKKDARLGTGLGVRDTLCNEPWDWPGLNLLGLAWEAVRDEL